MIRRFRLTPSARPPVDRFQQPGGNVDGGRHEYKSEYITARSTPPGGLMAERPQERRGFPELRVDRISFGAFGLGLVDGNLILVFQRRTAKARRYCHYIMMCLHLT